MAITNAQQYQQLVNKPANGKRPGYKGSDWGPGASSPGTTKSGGNKNTSNPNEATGGNRRTSNNTSNNVNTGNAREDYITNYVSRGAVKGGGEKKKGAVDNNNDGRDDRTGEDIYDEKIVSRDEVNRGQSNFREQFIDYRGGSRPMTLSQRNNINYQNRIFNQARNNLINQLNQSGLLTPELLKGLEEDDKLYDRDGDGKITEDDLTVENLRDTFQVSDDTKGADYGKRSLNLDALTGIKSIQDYVDEGFYKKDGVFDKNSNIYDKDRIPGPFKPTGTSLDVLGKIFAGPLTQEYLTKQFNNLEEIGSIPFNSNQDTSIKALMEKYEPNRFKLENSPRETGPSQATDPCLGPNPPAYCNVNNTTDPEDPKQILTTRILGSQFDPTFFANEGGRAGLAEGGMPYEGGIMDLESGRQMYFLGKLVKKATRAVKKIVKSPIGKAALFAAPFAMSGGSLGAGLGKFFGKGSLNPFLAKSIGGDQMFSGLGSILSKAGLVGKSGLPTLKGGLALTSLLPLLSGKEEDDFDINAYYAANQLTPGTTKRQMGSEFDFYNYNLAEGGMPSKEPVAKETMPLIDMDGKEMDLRAEGGFVPIGRMEKADDVPARLSKNEFVFTADAVRNAGEGDIDKGAEVMYNMMKNLESGGEVSEESQGLDGAREMFQTSQRLGEVL